MFLYKFYSFIEVLEVMQDLSDGIYHDELKLHSILSNVSHSSWVLTCSLGLETLKILIFVRHRGTDPKGMEKSSYTL